METITVTLPAEQIQETLIALRDRSWSPGKEYRAATSDTVRSIIARQQLRVERCIQALAPSVGE